MIRRRRRRSDEISSSSAVVTAKVCCRLQCTSAVRARRGGMRKGKAEQGKVPQFISPCQRRRNNGRHTCSEEREKEGVRHVITRSGNFSAHFSSVVTIERKNKQAATTQIKVWWALRKLGDRTSSSRDSHSRQALFKISQSLLCKSRALLLFLKSF